MADNIKPDPDPTTLTTDALHREIAELRRSIIDIIDLKEETTSEKFRGIASQFELRDTATDKLAIADQKALNAALQTQIESASKSEAGFTKQIDGIGRQIADLVKSFDDKINDLKSRLDRGDGRTNGVADIRTDTRLNVGMIVGIIGSVGMLLSLIIAAIAIMKATP
jgi:hypothetical protein